MSNKLFKIENRRITSSTQIDSKTYKVKVEYTIKKSTSLANLKLSYDPSYLELLNKKLDYKGPSGRLKYIETSNSCLECKSIIKSYKPWGYIKKSGLERGIGELVFEPLINKGILKLKLCTECYKAFKLFPPTSQDLEKLIKTQIIHINKFITKNKNTFSNVLIDELPIKSIRVTCK